MSIDKSVHRTLAYSFRIYFQITIHTVVRLNFLNSKTNITLGIDFLEEK